MVKTDHFVEKKVLHFQRSNPLSLTLHLETVEPKKNGTWGKKCPHRTRENVEIKEAAIGAPKAIKRQVNVKKKE